MVTKLQILLGTFLHSSATLAADCGTRKITDVVDQGTWASNKYDLNYWRAREGLCATTQPCSENSKECKITMLMDDQHALTLTHTFESARGDQTTCWDATAQIIEQCVRGESVAEGSWSWGGTAWAYAIVVPKATPNIGVVPDKEHTTPPGGGDPPTEPPTSACVEHGKKLEEVIQGLEGDEVCTNGAGNSEVKDDGNSQITRYSWEEMYLILAKTTPQRGFPDAWCWSKAEILQFIQQQTQFCSQPDFYRKGLKYPKVGDPPKGAGMYCLTNWDQEYVKCGNPEVY